MNIRGGMANTLSRYDPILQTKAREMRYLLAIVLPPVAVLLCGKPFQFLLNICLTLCFWIPGAIHALFVVSNHIAERRNRELMRSMGIEPKRHRSFRLT